MFLLTTFTERMKVTVDQMASWHGSGINPATYRDMSDRQNHYIISRQVCQPFSQKKRRGLHPHPCPDRRPLFFRFHPAGCLSYSFLPGTTPGPSKGGYYENTTRSSYSIAYLRHAVKFFILLLRTTLSTCSHPLCRLPLARHPPETSLPL